MSETEEASRALGAILGPVVCTECAGGGEVRDYRALALALLQSPVGDCPTKRCPTCAGQGFLCRGCCKPLPSTRETFCNACDS